MPYHICEVTSAELTHHPESGSGEDWSPAHDSQTIKCKIPKEDLHTSGRQLYAFLGIFILPRVIDSMWVSPIGFYPIPIKPVDPIQPVDLNVEHQQKKNCWKELDRWIFTVPNVALLLAIELIPSIYLIVCNLVYVLLNVRYYQTRRFSMQETVINGEEVWEVSCSQAASVDKKKVEAGSWKTGERFPVTPSQGDKVKVSFGPIEYWCLFRKQTQSDATARSPSPVFERNAPVAAL